MQNICIDVDLGRLLVTQTDFSWFRFVLTGLLICFSRWNVQFLGRCSLISFAISDFAVASLQTHKFGLFVKKKNIKHQNTLKMLSFFLPVDYIEKGIENLNSRPEPRIFVVLLQ